MFLGLAKGSGVTCLAGMHLGIYLQRVQRMTVDWNKLLIRLVSSSLLFFGRALPLSSKLLTLSGGRGGGKDFIMKEAILLSRRIH